MHRNINFNLFSVSVLVETGMGAEIRFRFGFGYKNLFRSVTSLNRHLDDLELMELETTRSAIESETYGSTHVLNH